LIKDIRPVRPKTGKRGIRGGGGALVITVRGGQNSVPGGVNTGIKKPRRMCTATGQWAPTGSRYSLSERKKKNSWEGGVRKLGGGGAGDQCIPGEPRSVK